MIWCVIWVVLMMLWLFGGGYYNWDSQRPYAAGSVFIAWLCVLILGLIIFGAITVGPIR